MFRAFARALSQLSDPAFARVILLSVVATLVLFGLLLTAVSWTLYETDLFAIPWLDTTVDVLGSLAVLAIAWLLFPAVVITVSSLMLESVVRAVERRHYPGLGPAREQPVIEGIANSAKFLGIVIILNVLVLPLYFIPLLNLVTYYCLNGYLLGREYYELVSLRRLDPQRMRYLRSEESMGLFLAGVIIAFLSVVPIVNLLVPVIATAFMVHVFEDMRRRLPQPGAA